MWFTSASLEYRILPSMRRVSYNTQVIESSTNGDISVKVSYRCGSHLRLLSIGDYLQGHG